MATKKTQTIKHEYPILVSVQMGATVNVGNYESRKVSLGITYPVWKDTAVKGVKKQLEKYVEGEINKKVDEIKVIIRKELPPLDNLPVNACVDKVTSEVTDIDEVAEEVVE